MNPEIALSLIIVLGIACALPAAFFVLGRLSRDRHPRAEGNVPYECGILPQYDARHRVPVRFHLVAVMFILFDVEVAFVIPWAVGLRGLGFAGFVSMAIFVGMLMVGLYYLIRRGALEWD